MSNLYPYNVTCLACKAGVPGSMDEEVGTPDADASFEEAKASRGLGNDALGWQHNHRDPL
jgi:hypothetical protein